MNKKLSFADIEMLKMASSIKREAFNNTKGDKCYICGGNCSSFCQSHSIPRFVLDNIAEDGKIFLSTAVMEDGDKLKSEFLKPKKGIKEALTFSSICNKCDNEVFQKIESIDNILRLNYTEEEYNLLALKILLSRLFQKQYDYNLINESKKIRTDSFTDSMSTWWLFDIIEYTKELANYLDARKKGTFIKHKIILDTIINNKINFACNIEFTPKYSYYGEKINDLSDPDKYAVRFGGIYLIIYPLENCTRIIMFYRRKYSQYDIIKKEFEDMNSIEEKLESISNLILLYSDQYVYNQLIKLKLKFCNWDFVYDPTQIDSIKLYKDNLDNLKRNQINLFKI